MPYQNFTFLSFRPFFPSLYPSLSPSTDTLIPFSSLGIEDAIWPVLHLPLQRLLRPFGTHRPPTSLPVLLPFNTLEKQYYLFGVPLSTKRFKGGYENTEACHQTFDVLRTRVYLLIEEGKRLREEDRGRYIFGRAFEMLGWGVWWRKGEGREEGRGGVGGVMAGIGTLLGPAGGRGGRRAESERGRSGEMLSSSRKKEGREKEERREEYGQQQQEQDSLRQRKARAGAAASATIMG